MALVSNIQLQNGAVKPPNLDTNLKYTAAGLTATEAIAVGTVPVSTSGSITVKSANDIRNWIQTTKTDGNVEIYMSNDARPDWALRVAGTADNAFVIANSYGSNCTAQFPAFSIGGAGAVGLGKTGATNILDIAYKNSATGGIQLTETQNNVGMKLIAEATSGSIGSTSNHKLGFRVNGTTVAAFNTSTQFGIGTDSPGATLDVRGAAIFNEAGAAVDFRIEGDAEQNLFFVDGSADAIGMGTATPVDTSRLHVMGTDGDAAATHSGDAMLIVENCGTTFLELATGNGNHAGLTFSDAAAATRGAVLYDHGTGLGGAADTMHFQTAGSIRAVIDSSGEVGIGTLAPAAALHLAGVDDPEIRIQGAADGDPQINFYQSTNCRGTIMYKDTGDNFVMDSNGKLTLQTDSTPRIVMTNAGCVGIGTNAVASACGAELDIFSAGASTGLILRSGNSSAASASLLGEGYRANGDSEQVLQLVGRNKNAGVDLGIFEVAAESLHCLGALELKTFDGSSMTTKMKISSGGCVGIGTNSPTDIFHVRLGSNLNWKFGYPNNSVTTLAALNDAESAYVTARIDASVLELNGQSGGDVNLGDGIIYVDTSQDYVGINTSTPNTELEISSTDARTTLTMDNRSAFSDGSTRNSISFESINDTDARSQYAQISAITTAGTYGGGELAFVTRRPGDGSNAESMRIDDAGQVGIGTDAPSSLLHLQSRTDSTNAMEIDNAAGCQLVQFFPTTAGVTLNIRDKSGFQHAQISSYEHSFISRFCNLGVGTGSPAVKLDVCAAASTVGMQVDASSGKVELQSDGQIYGYQKLSVATAGMQIKGYSDGGGTKTQTAGISLLQKTNSAAGGYISFLTHDGTSVAERATVNKNGDFTVDTDTLFVDASADRVGINTSVPTKALSVVGDAVFDGPTQTISSAGAGRVAAAINLDSNYSFENGYTADGTISCSDYLGALYFNTADASGNGAGVGAAIRSMVLDPYGRYSLDFHTTGNSASEGDDALRMRINHAGLVGINTASPAAMLDINGVGRSTAVCGVPATGTGAEFFIDSGKAYFQGYNRTGSAFVETRFRGSPIVLEGGNVGVGTTAPAVNLHVNNASSDGIARISTEAAGDFAQLQFVNSCGCYWYQTLVVTDCSLRFYNGSDRVTFAADGNVGIGTASPSSWYSCNLVVSAANTGGITIAATATDALNYLMFGDGTSGNAPYRGQLLYDHGNDKMQFATAAAARMTIDSSGLVAIGTANPSCYSTSADDFVIAKDASAVGMSIRSSSTGTGNIFFVNNEASNANNGVIIFNHDTGEFSFDNYVSGRHYTFNLANSEVVRIDGTGLGIGTTAPAYRLESSCSSQSTSFPLAIRNPDNSTCLSGVGILGGLGRNGDSTIQYYAMMCLIKEQTWTTTGSTIKGSLTFSTPCNESGVERMRINSSGNVGIGTTAPAHNLHVVCDADNAVIEIESTASNSNPAFRLKNDAQEWQWQLRGAEADSLVGWDVTGGAGRLYLTTAGNLGLGTTCPTSRVMVEGTGTTTLNSCSKWISIGAGGAATYTSNNVYGIGFGYTNVDNKESAAFFGYKVTNAAAAGAGRLLFATRTSTNGSCAPTERATILDDGKFGIGTATPRANLTVHGNSTTSATFGVDNTSGSSTLDISALGSLYNAHGVTACTVWFYSPDDINIGGATSNCNAVRFISNGALNMSIDGCTRNVGIGTVPLGAVFWEGSISSRLQVSSTGGDSSITIIRNHSLYGPTLILARNGGSIGTNTLANAGESVGGINYQANDGSKYVQVATINATMGDKAAASCMSAFLTFNTNPGSNGSVQERMRITQCGRVGIGTATPNGNLHVVGSVQASTFMTAGGGIYISRAPGDESEPTRITSAASGGGTCTLFIGNAAIQTSSDIRVKNNVQCYTCSAVDVLENARVVEFEYDKEKISDNSDFGPASRGKYVGLIAQEMIKYARWAINDGEGDPEGEHIWKAEYQHMVPLLIKAVQELNERVAELESAA